MYVCILHTKEDFSNDQYHYRSHGIVAGSKRQSVLSTSPTFHGPQQQVKGQVQITMFGYSFDVLWHGPASVSMHIKSLQGQEDNPNSFYSSPLTFGLCTLAKKITFQGWPVAFRHPTSPCTHSRIQWCSFRKIMYAVIKQGCPEITSNWNILPEYVF